MRSLHTARGRSPRLCIAAVPLIVLALAHPARAQMQTTTAITGTVTDPAGAPVPAAAVAVNEQHTGALFRTTTNESGVYSFPALLPGVYTITVTKQGFETAAFTDRSAMATQPATVDVALRIGQSAQTVTVSEAGAELLTTADQTITGTITPTLVENLPDVRGNMFDLLALAPAFFPKRPPLTTAAWACRKPGMRTTM